MARRKRGWMATQALTEPTKLGSTTARNAEPQRHEPRMPLQPWSSASEMSP